MLNPDELPALYVSTSEKTLARWARFPEAGEIKTQAFYDPHRLAITSGIQPALTEPLRNLLGGLSGLAAGDELADVMSPAGLHFTFFAITMPVYQRADVNSVEGDLPAIFAEQAENMTVNISNLQLVALPNQLLIAGTPDAASQAAKEAFARRLIDSPWHDKLRERHGDIPLPPPFWHSTVLRYRADYLPARFREYFLAHRTDDYGAVSARVKLAFTNYNWTEVYGC